MSSPARRGTIAAGFAALQNWRLAAILLLATLVPAAIVASAFWPSLRDGLGGTLAGEHILRNDPLLAPEDAFDFLYDRRVGVSAAWNAAWFAAFSGVLFQILFAGGFVRSLARARRARVMDFVEGSLHDFWHNLKCFVLFSVMAAVVVGAWLAAWRAISRRLFENAPPASAGTFAANLVTIGGALILFAALSLWQDFARAARRISPGIGAFRAYGFARRRLAGRRARALAVLIFWVVAGGAVLAALLALSLALPAASGPAVLMLFVVQLAALCVRPFTRVAAWGSYIALLDEASLPEPPATVVAPFLEATPVGSPAIEPSPAPDRVPPEIP